MFPRDFADSQKAKANVWVCGWLIQGRFAIGSLTSQWVSKFKHHQLTNNDCIPTEKFQENENTCSYKALTQKQIYPFFFPISIFFEYNNWLEMRLHMFKKRKILKIFPIYFWHSKQTQIKKKKSNRLNIHLFISSYIFFV